MERNGDASDAQRADGLPNYPESEGKTSEKSEQGGETCTCEKKLGGNGGAGELFCACDRRSGVYATTRRST